MKQLAVIFLIIIAGACVILLINAKETNQPEASISAAATDSDSVVAESLTKPILEPSAEDLALKERILERKRKIYSEIDRLNQKYLARHERFAKLVETLIENEWVEDDHIQELPAVVGKSAASLLKLNELQTNEQSKKFFSDAQVDVSYFLYYYKKHTNIMYDRGASSESINELLDILGLSKDIEAEGRELNYLLSGYRGFWQSEDVQRVAKHFGITQYDTDD